MLYINKPYIILQQAKQVWAVFYQAIFVSHVRKALNTGLAFHIRIICYPVIVQNITFSTFGPSRTSAVECPY